MKSPSKSNVFLLRAELLKHGLTVQAFATKHGFKYSTVIKVIQRHWCTKRRLRGTDTVTMEILDALKSYSGQSGRLDKCKGGCRNARTGSL